MADGGRHFPQGGELRRLRERLFGHGQILLHLFTLGDFAFQAGIQLAQFSEFAPQGSASRARRDSK